MGISIYNIKRWGRMLTGKSIYHVEQNIGKAFEPGRLGGYFNDMTQKVLLGNNNLDDKGIPFLEHSNGSHIQMPTMIFQYGLGAYDLWVIKKERQYLDKAILCADWAIEHQETNGAWNTFFYIYPDAPYSAMPQGEATSLLLRVYNETSDERYIESAKRAVSFMLTDVKDGGVANYSNGELKLLEYTHLPLVMNGWIFALFGIYDYSLITGEYKEQLDLTVESLENKLPAFDCGYWSMYDEGGKISSPFYHNLHIAQLQALYEVTGIDAFNEYALKFMKYQSKGINRKRAFVHKAMQKILD